VLHTLLLTLLLLASTLIEAEAVPPPITRTTGLQPQNLGLIVNTDDPDSEAVVRQYLFWHPVPAQNVVRVSLGREERITRQAFEAKYAVVQQKMPANVQFLGLAFRAPARVDGSNSITSAFARGFYARPAGQASWGLGYQNPYDYRQNHSEPYTRHGIRPAMMIAGGTPASTYALIERGAMAEDTAPQTNHGLLMLTTDSARQIRAIGAPPTQQFGPVTLRVFKGNRAPLRLATYYFQGLSRIPDLTLLRYRPGAWVDTLTSCAGMFDGCGGQVTVWQIIDAGATGSYGTVEEPYAQTGKFVDPDKFLKVYTDGYTLIEAAWRSVDFPYQGLFVGDPLTAPYGKRL
jgi:uncharacterized protein (TIGR03790 family)